MNAPAQPSCPSRFEPADIENMEIDLLLDAIHRRYGYDFKHYARASMRRRIRQVLLRTERQHISALIPELLHDQTFFEDMVREFSITVTEMFRTPDMFRVVRDKVLPYLKTYPHFKVWHAGCATGEEAYSLAILLREEGAYERATIFATDFNDEALQRARDGIYAIDRVQQFSGNYQQSGGLRSFSEYYHARYDSIVIDRSVRDRVTFANHNLVIDEVFTETHLIFCRNVLIYFDRQLQERVLHLFYDSLVHGGFLCLGDKESLEFSGVGQHFSPIDRQHRVYRKTAFGSGEVV